MPPIDNEVAIMIFYVSFRSCYLFVYHPVGNLSIRFWLRMRSSKI